jgi:hypothetical protein
MLITGDFMGPHARIAIIFTVLTLSTSGKDTVEPLKIGNLALPFSQLPSPLFSFGQNLVSKHDVVIGERLNYLKMFRSRFPLLTARFLYGITRKWAYLLEVPVAVKNKVDRNTFSGLGAIILNTEYAFYYKWSKTAIDLGTVVLELHLPSPSRSRALLLEDQTSNFFLGTTLSHLGIDWYLFTSHGALFTTRRNQVKAGNTFLYELGIGHNLGNPPGCILCGLIEFNGVYHQPDNVRNRTMNGNNVIFCGPVLFFSTINLIFQAGIQFPLYQTNSRATKVSYRAGLTIAWTLTH